MEEVTVDDLRPITLVMYAAALIPGGELNFFQVFSASADQDSIQKRIS
jgi:hypothetical protein